MTEKVCETADELKTPAECCKTGNVPLTIVNVFSYEATLQSGEKIFGEYDDRVKKILKENNYWIGGVGEIGDRPHCRILPDERGFCHFYDDKKNKCMLGDERPSRC